MLLIVKAFLLALLLSLSGIPLYPGTPVVSGLGGAPLRRA